MTFLKNAIGAFFIIMAFFWFSSITFGVDVNQQILDLRTQVEILTKQAAQYQNNINQKQKEADTLSRQISILNNQILQLETQISITNNQINSAKIQIADLESKIFDAQEKINREKSAIGRLIAVVNERDKMSMTAILIKNQTLAAYSDAVKEDQQMNDRLNDMLVQVKKEKDDLQINKSNLESKKQELETLNDRQITQQSIVKETKTDKDKLLTTTKGKEAEYQKLLAEVEKKQNAFFEELKRLEEEALKSGAFIVHVTAKFIPAKKTWNIRWPEDSYRITQGYGMTAYAKKGAYGGSPHNGVDMAHGAGTPIHPIDNGTILASGYSDGWGNWVSILHANNMVSLYGHFKSPSGLANGTKVLKDSIIGYEGTTGNSTGSHLHLSIYKDFFTYFNAKHKNQLYFNYFDGTINPFDYLP